MDVFELVAAVAVGDGIENTPQHSPFLNMDIYKGFI